MRKKGLLIVVSGPSGAGKGTVCREWLSRNPETELSISVTARSPRPTEVEGRITFRSRQEFENMIERNEFLEYAKCTTTITAPRRYVQQKLMEGRDVILEIDIQGA